jgi:hypothetical protein
MTQDAIRALTDADLSQLILWGQAEVKARRERHKQETIANKRAGRCCRVKVAISGQRGRPAQGARKAINQRTYRS